MKLLCSETRVVQQIIFHGRLQTWTIYCFPGVKPIIEIKNAQDHDRIHEEKNMKTSQ